MAFHCKLPGFFVALLLLALPVIGEAADVECDKSTSFLAPIDSSDARKYAPDREIDILNLALDVTPDFKLRTVSGKAILTFKPIAKPFVELHLDAIDLHVDSVGSTEKIQGYQVTREKIIITFVDPVPAGKEASVTITYSAEPTAGLYFRTPEMGYREGDTHLFSQGESIEARHWFPCFDAPNEKFTSEITCRVPADMTVLSNGRLVSEERDAATGLKVVHWKQEKPHANYLISLVAGHLKKIEDRYKDIPLAFYTPASEINEAATSFRETKEAMAYFEKEIGVPYPWAKYYQVCVNDFVAGGMENTSITTLTDSTLFTDATENLHSSEGLVAHELAHQWFGDLVTCKDWSHLWLNEGFATYYAHLFDGHQNGQDAMLYHLYQDAKGLVGRSDDTRSIVYRQFDSPDEQFSHLAYQKGGWVLHMLRSQLGEDLYRRCIQTYLERHQYDNVVTSDLSAVIEELSGRSHDRFFDQWVYHGHHPELDIHYGWDERSRLARVSIRQTQKLSDAVLLFQFPLTIRFKTGASIVDRQIMVKEKSEDFYFSLPEAPRVVRVDPQLTLLARIQFSVPDAMLREQIKDKDDAMGRILAIEQMAGRSDHASIDSLKAVLKDDPFFGARIEAVRALSGLHSDEAFQALVDSLDQKDARVRRQVLTAVTGFYRVDAYKIASQQIDLERNPDIQAVAVSALGAYSKSEVHDRLVRALNSTSHRNTLAIAGIRAMRAQDDPSYLEPLQRTLREREAVFTSNGLGAALETLAYLGRNEEKKDGVREFLLSYVNHRKRTVQVAALQALGTLGDPKAMAVLSTFANARKENPVREAADKALATLRSAKKPTDVRAELNNEVLELQKDNRDLKRDFDELKRRVEASETRSSDEKGRK